MGFCFLGGRENPLRKAIADKLTALGQAVNMGAMASAFTTAIQNIYDNRYTAGQDSLKTNRKLTLTSSQTGSNVDITDNWYTTVDASAVYTAGQNSLKVDRKLTLPAAATGTNYNITDNWYTTVDASAVYNAGEVQGRAANKGMTVYSIQTAENGSGQLKSTVTQTLPAGTYHCAVHLYTHGLGVNYMPTVMLTFGNTTRTYHDSVPSTGVGYYESGGNQLQVIDTFTLSSNTSVTLFITKPYDGNTFGGSNGIASVY